MRLICSAFFVVLIALTGCSETKQADRKSPQSTYNSLLAAINHNDHGLLWDVLSDDKRSQCAGAAGLQAFAILRIIEQSNAGAPKAALDMDHEFKQVLLKHGLTVDQLKNAVSDGAGAVEGKELLDAAFDDKAFFVDLLAATKAKVSELYRVSAGELIDLEFKGDWAIATLPDKKSDVRFKNADGQWFFAGFTGSRSLTKKVPQTKP